MAQSTMTANKRALMTLRYAEGEDITQCMDRVEAEADWDKGRCVVERGLHRVHVGPREGGGVVGLVVEAVNLETDDMMTLLTAHAVLACL